MIKSDARRRPLQAFRDYATRPPAPWQRAAYVVVAVVVPLALWERRGLALGVLAAGFYAAVFLSAALSHGSMVAWSRRHVVLDRLLIGPLVFFGLACLTSLSLLICGIAAVSAGVVLVAVGGWRSRGLTV